MRSSQYSYLLPAYANHAKKDKMDAYDGIDSDFENNLELFDAADFLEHHHAPYSLPADSETEETSAEADDIEKLRERLNALLQQFPNYSVQLKAAAYQAGIYEPNKSIAYDPQINTFFRGMDNIDESKMPKEVAEFCKEMKNLTNSASNSSSLRAGIVA